MAGATDDKALGGHPSHQRILAAIDGRQVANFSGLPEAERRIDAGFLQRLISGSGGPEGEICCPLRIRGAHITGPLRPPTGSNHGGRLALQFRDCDFDSPVDMSGAEFLVLRFNDCRLPAFIGASLRVGADLDLSGSRFSGVTDYESELSHVGTCAIHLNNARIGGTLDLSSNPGSRFSAAGIVRCDGARIDGAMTLAGASLDGGGDGAVSARSVTVGGNVDLDSAHGYRFEARGEVAFVAAQIVGDLDCSGARLWNPEGRALHCEDIKLESVFLTADSAAGLPFEASGRLNFLTALVGGSFFLTNARLAPGPDYQGVLFTGGPVAINLRQARISNALALNQIGALGDGSTAHGLDEDLVPVRGWFLLTGSEMTTLLDSIETGWPAAGFLDIDGASYERIRHLEPGELTSKRVAWLRRQFRGGVPTRTNFRPQPYEQLSGVLRQHGLSNEANVIAVEKIRMRLAARVDGPLKRIFPRVLMLISHYGYSSSRAVLSFLLFVLAGATMYATALFAFQQPFLPVESDPAPVTYELPFGLAELSAERGCPGLDVLHYALDAALPVIDLAQDQRCRFTPEGPARGLWLLAHSLYVIIGTALSAVVVLTLTGVLRQD